MQWEWPFEASMSSEQTFSVPVVPVVVGVVVLGGDVVA